MTMKKPKTITVFSQNPSNLSIMLRVNFPQCAIFTETDLINWTKKILPSNMFREMKGEIFWDLLSLLIDGKFVWLQRDFLFLIYIVYWKKYFLFSLS